MAVGPEAERVGDTLGLGPVGTWGGGPLNKLVRDSEKLGFWKDGRLQSTRWAPFIKMLTTRGPGAWTAMGGEV